MEAEGRIKGVVIFALQRGIKKLLLPLLVKAVGIGLVVLLVLMSLTVLFESAASFSRGSMDQEGKLRALQARYSRVAEKTCKGIEQQPYQVPWGLLMALDKLSNNFTSPSSESNSQLLKPLFKTHISIIRTIKNSGEGAKKSSQAMVEKKVELIDGVDTYNGIYTYRYSWSKKQVGEGIWEEKEELRNIEFRPDNQRLRDVLSRIGLSPTKDLSLVVALGDQYEGKSPLLEWTTDTDRLFDQEPVDDHVSIGTGKMGWPLGDKGLLTSLYGWRIHPLTGKWRLHQGIDIGAPMDTEVLAPSGGIVRKAGFSNGYGNVVIIEHRGGLSTLYAHLNAYGVNLGDGVEAGQVIGWVGNTGKSTGPHLHFEVRIGQKHYNPLDFVSRK